MSTRISDFTEEQLEKRFNKKVIRMIKLRVNPDIIRIFKLHRGLFTNRQAEVVYFLCRGMTNRQIAEFLFITEKTVKFHMTDIFYKLGVRSRAQASIKVMQLIGKLIPLQPETIPASRVPELNDFLPSGTIGSQPDFDKA